MNVLTYGGALNALLPKRENFESTLTSSYNIIVNIVLGLALAYSTWKLTGSKFQVVLCLVFGVLYVMFAWIYYGLKKYKFTKQ